MDAANVLEQGDVFVKPSSHKSEERIIAMGPIKGRFIAVVYTMRGGVHRIISARAARQTERKDYDEAKGKNR